MDMEWWKRPYLRMNRAGFTRTDTNRGWWDSSDGRERTTFQEGVSSRRNTHTPWHALVVVVVVPVLIIVVVVSAEKTVPLHRICPFGSLDRDQSAPTS